VADSSGVPTPAPGLPPPAPGKAPAVVGRSRARSALRHPAARSRRRALCGLLALALGLGACSTGSPASLGHQRERPERSSPATPSRSAGALGGRGRLSWHTCHGSFRCATLAVPESYLRPGGSSFHLAVIEAPATADPAGAPDLVLNPGGPGGSGVQFLLETAAQLAPLRRHFNLVSFDPRGVGESDPVSCGSAADLERLLALDPAPSTPSQVATVVAGTRAFVRTCERDTAYGVLDHVSTLDTARDMDRLRAALGKARLDYLGFSYGTYLGSVYAELFPGRVGRFVLDGAIDPALPAATFLAEQAAGFEGDLRDFEQWCSSRPSCAGSFTAGVPAGVDRLLARLESGATLPVAASLAPPTRLDYGLALTGILAGLYSTSSWPYLGQALAAAVAGSGSDLLGLADSYAGISPGGSASNALAANVAINCVDRRWPSSVPAIERLVPRLARVAPVFGPSEAWGSLACGFWPVPPGRGGAVHLPRPLAILVVGSTGDPATPYAWARALVSQLEGSRLLTRVGDGHTAYFASTCIATFVDRYLVTGRLPPPGTVCR
jgi:pimeloyl-ACP methyl ester carboxylesterase